MARLRVAVLGAPEVWHGDQAVAFPTRKALALLIYLLVEGGPQSRDKLAALFWPESGDHAARATLRSTMARLRQGLAGSSDSPRLIVDRAVVAFDANSDFDFDLHRLNEAYDLARSLPGKVNPLADSRQANVDRLQQAANLWRGDFLEGFTLRDAPDFDDWTSLQREVWQRRTELVLDRLSHLYADSGGSTSAIETVNRWLRLNPLEERAHRRLMRLHIAARDRAAALAAYVACSQVLDRELGVLPDPETTALAERIRVSPAATRVAGPTRRRTAAPTAREEPLVGREDEFTKLFEFFHTARQGRPQVVVLHGEAGRGKTRLATEFTNWAAAQGANVLQGRAFETGVPLPYQPLVDALRPRLERKTALAELVNPAWLAELSRLFPELRARFPDLRVPEGDEASARTRLFEAFARFGDALSARAPVVLFVDDLQWADVASLDVMRYALRRWMNDASAVLIVACLRSDALAASPALDEWLLALHRETAVATVELGPLNFEATMQLVQGLDPEWKSGPSVESFAQWIFAETRGQPFYIVETLQSLRERDEPMRPHGTGETAAAGIAHQPERGQSPSILPAPVRQLIRARIAPLPRTARELLAAAAVLGQGFSFDLVCHVGRMEEDEALPAFDAVLSSRLLQVIDAAESEFEDERYGFTHDKIREVAYHEAGEARRRVLHRRAVEALETAGAPAAELAHHALAGGRDEPALRFSVTAGDEAMRLLAARDAVAHYERAMVLAERLGQRKLLPDLHARCGRAFFAMGGWSESRRELEKALAGFAPRDAERHVEVLTDIAEAYWWELDVPAVLRHAVEAQRLAKRLGRGDLEARAIAWHAAAEGALGNLPACGDMIKRALDRAQESGISAPTIVGHYHPLTLYWLGKPREAIIAAREAVSVAQERNDISWLMTAFPNLGLALAATGQYGEALAAFAEARRLGREYGQETLLARAIAVSTGFRFEVFDFAGAEALSHEARDLARSLNFLPPAVSAGIDLLLNYTRQGEVGKAEPLVDDVAAAIEETGGFHGWQWRMRLAAAHAEMALVRGEQGRALHWANETIAQSRARGRPKYEVIGLTARAAHFQALGRTKVAIADLTCAVALARQVGDPALFVRPAALLLHIDGDDDLATEGRAIVNQITQALPDETMRCRFEFAEPVRILAGWDETRAASRTG